MNATDRSSRWPTVLLADLIADATNGLACGERDSEGTLQVRMNNVGTDGSLDLVDLLRIPASSDQISRYCLEPGDVLFNNTNSTELVGKSALFPGHNEPVLFSNHFTRLRTRRERLAPSYLARWLTKQQESEVFARMCNRWVNQSAVRKEALLGLTIPLPPLSEQIRIAAILDQADAIRRKRKQARDTTGELPSAIFHDMFGDPASNRRSWPSAHFEDLLSAALRNGESPASAGPIRGKVLTLSAITGRVFDPCAWKEAEFAHFHEDSRVSTNDFLICRGNGNRDLVGTAKRPTIDMPDTVFPDTMIVARVASDRLDLSFLQAQWETQHVRWQILHKARTTNGTYKINQQVICDIRLIVPPLSVQAEFANRVASVQDILVRQDEAYATACRTFDSLVQQALPRPR